FGGSPPAGVGLPALAARLIAMAARCAGVAGSHPSEAGSPQRVTGLLAMAARYAGRSSDSALCNLPQAANLSVAKACWLDGVAAFPAGWPRRNPQKGRRRPWHRPAQTPPARKLP